MSRVLCLSTDKAVYPINAMGISKAMMEKVMVAKARSLEGSRHDGLRHAIRQRHGLARLSDSALRGADAGNQPLTVTDPNMTRFMMTLDDAVDLVLYAFQHGSNGDIFVQKAPAATIAVLADAIRGLAGRPAHELQVIGTRHGEKLYEVLLEP